MAIIKWDPFKELISMQERMNNIFGDNFLRPTLGEREMKDIDVKIEDNTLRIRGERKLEREDKKENYHRMERYYGTFSRSFTLPSTVDQEKVKATYDRGILKIFLPKKEETKPKKIKIDVT